MSPFIDVYRVEHAEGRTGPFTTDRTYGYSPSRLDLDANKMPTVARDVVVDGLADTVTVDDGTLRAFRRLPDTQGSDDWRFAFPSIETMQYWMSVADRRLLARHGFVLRTYRAPRGAVLIRREQVTFDPSLAVETETETLI